MLCYEGEIRRARRRGRLPHEAEAVYQELTTKLRWCIRETALQRQERVEKEFKELVMGTLPHGKFRIMWEDKLEDLETAEVQMPDSETFKTREIRIGESAIAPATM